MAMEGNYERSATVLLAGRVPIARLAIFLEGLEEKPESIKNVTNPAISIDPTGITNTTSPKPEPHDHSIYLRPVKLGREIDDFAVVETLLSDAISVALAYVADGLGNQRVTWRDLQWKPPGIGMNIWPKRGVSHLMTWQRALQVLLQTQELVQSQFGYFEFTAQIIWTGGAEEEDIGEIQLKLITRTTIVPSERPITAALGNLTTPSNGGDIIYLRYTFRGEYIPPLSVLGVFKGAIGAALDELEEGKSEDPVSWQELKYFGINIFLVVRAYEKANHRLTWSMLTGAEEMMIKHLSRSGFREMDADIMWKDTRSSDNAEVVGTIKLMSDTPPKTDAASTIDTA